MIPDAQQRSTDLLLSRASWDGDCLITGHARFRSGYPAVNCRVDGVKRMVQGHRLALATATGRALEDIPSDEVALHSCDTPACVNADHLRWGTLSDNTQDMISRGRARWQKRPPRTHCRRGHRLAGANVEMVSSHRACRLCRIAYARMKYSRGKMDIEQALAATMSSRRPRWVEVTRAALSDPV